MIIDPAEDTMGRFWTLSCCFEKKQNVSQSSWWTVATDLKMFRFDTILLRYSECSIFRLRCDVFSYYSGFILQIFVWLRVKMHLLFNIFRYLDTQMLQPQPVQEGCWRKEGSNWISVHVNRVNVESELLDDNHSLLVTRETLRAFLQMKWLVSFKSV